MRDRILSLLGAGFVGGVLAQTVLGGVEVLVVCAVFAALFLVSAIVRRSTVVLVVAGVFIAGLAGAVRYEYHERTLRDPYLAPMVGTRVMLEGFVVDEPDERDTKTVLVVRAERVEGVTTDVRIRVSVPTYPVFSYGNRVRAEGIVREPEAFEGDDGRVFNYERFLAKEGIGYEMAFPQVAQEEGVAGSAIRRTLYDLKHALIDSLGRSIEEPEASLVAGMLVGAKQSLGERLIDTMRNAGIVHIIVLSGYNLTIVAEAIMRMSAWLPRVVSFAAGSVSIVLFALLAGAGATVVRAGIMALLVVLARALGRPRDLLRGLLVAGVVMVAHRPHILLYDLSFQLSFLATLGLIVFAPHVERRITWVSERWGMRAIVAGTISAELFVLPLLLFSIGNASVVGLVTNALVLPIVPLIMGIGFVAGILGFIAPILAFPVGLSAQALSAYVIHVAEWFGSLPFALAEAPVLPVWFLAASYGALGVLVWRLSREVSSSADSSRSTSALLR